jgi:DNA-binding XRE family transcriptional regulator
MTGKSPSIGHIIERSLSVNNSLPTKTPPSSTLPPMLGDELREARERAGLTQEKLSFRAGLSRPYISQLERGLKSPTLDTLFLLCDALGVSAADVVGRVEKARKRKPSP